MKKLFSIICYMMLFLILCGFNYATNSEIESIIGRGDHINIEIVSKRNYYGKSIKASSISNEFEKQNKIFIASTGEKSIQKRDLGITYWEQYSNKYIYNQLSERDKGLWDNLDVLFQPYLSTEKDYDNSEYLFIDGFTSYNELFDASFVYLYCHPQYFFLRPRFSAYKLNDKYGINIAFYDEFKNGQSRKQAINRVRIFLDDYVSQLTPYESDYEKIKQIHNLICQRVSYDNAVVADDYNWDIDPLFSQSIYSGIVTDKMVCAGYAKMFNCLANAVGLDTIAINGSGHAWNIVKCEDEWFYVDATWNDCSSYYGYFLVMQSKFTDQSHFKNDYWDKYITEPTYNYRSFRYKGNDVLYASGDNMFHTYNIDYILGQGSISGFNNTELYKLPTYYYPTVQKKIWIPSIHRCGYSFKGWYFQSKKINQLITNGKEMVVNAKWSPNTYKIVFKKKTVNSSIKKVSGKVTSVNKAEYDKSVALPKCEYTCPGYKFIGWTDEKNGKEVKYPDECHVVNLTSVNGKTVKLYALWKEAD